MLDLLSIQPAKSLTWTLEHNYLHSYQTKINTLALRYLDEHRGNQKIHFKSLLTKSNSTVGKNGFVFIPY